MFQNTKKGDIVKIPTDNGDAWAKVLNDEPKQGTVHVTFKKHYQLDVHYLYFNNNFLTWVLTV